MKKLIFASLLAVGTMPILAQAADGTLNFTGRVTNTTCVIRSGDADGVQTVRLNPVDASAFNATRTVLGAEFEVRLTNCPIVSPTDSQGTARILLRFSDATNADPRTGNLINRSANAARSNVQIGLSHDRGNADIRKLPLGSPLAQTESIASSRTGSVTFHLRADYIAVGTDAVTPGAVSTSIQFDIRYF